MRNFVELQNSVFIAALTCSTLVYQKSKFYFFTGVSKTKIKVKGTTPQKNCSNHWSKIFQKESLQQFLIKFNLNSLFRNCFAEVNWSTRESNLFLVIQAKWFLYLFLSKRFTLQTAISLKIYQFLHSLSPIVSTF